MEYLTDINNSLKSINEENVEYIDLFDYPELFYGTTNFTTTRLNLCKFPKEAQEEIKDYGAGAVSEMKNLNSSACGVRLRFFTDSKKLIFKVKFKRRWGYLKMVNWGGFGFDVYGLNNEEYIHRTVFAPNNGHNIFAETILPPENGQLCIFLPNYNTIEELYMGIEPGSTIKSLNYPPDKRLPVLFYGNSVTQGAAASHSGNSFPNIVSKILNRDILNISCSACCRGTDTMAELMGKINCHSIIIDYTRNAYSTQIFKDTHEKFYKKVRSLHPDKKIVLMTSQSFNHWRDYDEFDEIVAQTYKNAIDRGENTEIINQKQLFNDEDYDIIAIDSTHYTDYGMHKIAKKICELIEK